MYLLILKSTRPEAGGSRYLTRALTWTLHREVALRFKAEEVIPKYQGISANFRSSSYTLEIVRVED